MTSCRVAWALFIALLAGAGLIAQSAQNTQPQALTLRMIVVSTNEEATALLDRLKRGETFAVVARAVSIDPSASDGGLLGRVDVSSLRDRVRHALQGLRVGQFSPIAQVATGFAVFQVVSDAPGTPTALNPVSYAVISGTGSVKFVPDIGGLPEAEALLREFPKADNWNQDPRTICQARQDSLEAGTTLFENFFAPAAADLRKGRPPFELMQANLGMAQLYAYQGSMTRAVSHYEAAYTLALASVPTAVPQVEEMLGVAYLHKAGMDSNLFRQPNDSCLMPGTPGLAYARPPMWRRRSRSSRSISSDAQTMPKGGGC